MAYKRRYANRAQATLRRKAAQGRKRKYVPRKVQAAGPHKMFAGYSNTPLAVPGVQGTFLTVPGRIVSTLNSDSTANQATYLVCQWTNSQVKALSWSSTNRNLLHYTAKQLTDGKPQFIRPLAMTLRIRNTTVFTSMGGQVKMLNTPNQISWTWDGGAANRVSVETNDAIKEMMRANFDTKVYAAAEFRDSKETHALPAAQIAFKEYTTYQDIGAANWDIIKNAMITGAGKAAMNTIILEFPHVGTANQYEITLLTQDACRFQADTLYSQLEREGRFVNNNTFDYNVKRAGFTARAFRSS